MTPVLIKLPQPYLLVIDCEFTCIENPPSDFDYELIELGAVLVNANTLDSISSFQAFVKPVRNPTLSEFCAKLTNISQTEIDNAEPFADVWESFLCWLHGRECLFSSWGKGDLSILQKECSLTEASFPFTQHLDIKKAFSKCNRLNKRVGLKMALNLANVEREGAQHRALDDAINTTKLLPFVLGGEVIDQTREKVYRLLKEENFQELRTRWFFSCLEGVDRIEAAAE